MIKLLLLALGTLALAESQGRDYDYFYDYVDSPSTLQQQIQPAARPPPPRPAPVQQQSRGRAPQPKRQRPQQASRPAAQQIARGDALLDGPPTTPVPILIDSRTIDTKTGAFVYQYAGADGSEKFEVRYTNGTVVGNYTFINDLGEKETHVYSAGVVDPNAVDETTDPNYVDLGNYDLYKHLEQAYVHNDGASGFELTPSRASPQPSRPRAQPSRPRAQSRPAPRPAAPRPVAQRPPPRPAPVPLDFNDAPAHFSQPPIIAPTFDYEDVSVVAPPPPRAPAPVRGGAASRGRPRQQGAPRPPHRLDFSAQQNSNSFLDSLINQFQ